MQTAAHADLGAQSASQAPEPPPLSLSGALQAVVHELRLLVHDQLRLAALEARRAVRNLVLMIALALTGALLVITGWLALVAAAVAWAVDNGASWPLAFLIAAVIMVAVAVGLALWIKALGSRVMFALTLRWLRPPPGAGATAAASTHPHP